MQKHIKIYLDYFGYSEGDFIPSEFSHKEAVDIHHILPKGRGGKDEIANLIALTRGEHDLAHEYKISEETLKEIHNNFLKKYE
jgi:5-methylcytosine-specific restriction endonuclease McrA